VGETTALMGPIPPPRVVCGTTRLPLPF
jgi:hypothetical protein